MESEIHRFMVELDGSNFGEDCLRGLKLFEEFSGKNIEETIKSRRVNFQKSNAKMRRRLLAEVEKQTASFCTWLKEVKSLQADMAHFYSISLKSLLIGLPMGTEIGLLFGSIMSKLEE